MDGKQGSDLKHLSGFIDLVSELIAQRVIKESQIESKGSIEDGHHNRPAG